MLMSIYAKFTDLLPLSLWSDIVDDINDYINGKIEDWAEAIIQDCVKWFAASFLECFRYFLTLANSWLVGEFWENSLVLGFLDFSKYCASGMFAASIVFLIVDIAQQIAAGKGVAWINVFKGFLVGFMFATFSQTLPIPFIKKVYEILGNITIVEALESDGTLDVSTSVVVYLIMALVLLIAVIVFIGMFLARQATLMVHIMSAVFYIPDTVRGDTTKLGEWLRQFVAILATILFQYLLFFGGAAVFLANAAVMSANFYIGIALMLGAFCVPKVLNRFGYTVGNRDVLSSAQSAAYTGMHIKALLAK